MLIQNIYFDLISKSSGSDKIRRFRLESILGAKSGSTVFHELESKTTFHTQYETSFHVMADQKTVIGIENSRLKNVVTVEDLANDHACYLPIKFSDQSSVIQTLHFIRNANTLLAGDHDGTVAQYRHDRRKNTWKLAKKYHKLGIGSIKSSASVGHLAIFGGNQSGLRVIDTQNLKAVYDSFKVANDTCGSLQICRVGASEMFLSVSGFGSRYSPSETDILDISDLIGQHQISLPQTPKPTKMDSISNRTNSADREQANCECKPQLLLGVLKSQIKAAVDGAIKDSIKSILDKCRKSKISFLSEDALFAVPSNPSAENGFEIQPRVNFTDTLGRETQRAESDSLGSTFLNTLKPRQLTQTKTEK